MRPPMAALAIGLSAATVGEVRQPADCSITIAALARDEGSGGGSHILFAMVIVYIDGGSVAADGPCVFSPNLAGT